MTDYAELIAEARTFLFTDSDFGYEDSQEGDLIFRMMKALEAATSERDAALAAIERVRARHTQGTVRIVSHDGSSVPRETCLQCSQIQAGEYCKPEDTFFWPCPTVAALDGAPEPEVKP